MLIFHKIVKDLLPELWIIPKAKAVTNYPLIQIPVFYASDDPTFPWAAFATVHFTPSQPVGELMGFHLGNIQDRAEPS